MVYKKIALWIWQLPQHLLFVVLYGILLFFGKIEYRHTYHNKQVIRIDGKWGISLGNYILLGVRFTSKDVLHEFGHSVQSMYFGPLYLIIVGIPSITQNILSYLLLSLGHSSYGDRYYYRFPENWADRLGDVKRTDWR